MNPRDKIAGGRAEILTFDQIRRHNSWSNNCPSNCCIPRENVQNPVLVQFDSTDSHTNRQWYIAPTHGTSLDSRSNRQCPVGYAKDKAASTRRDEVSTVHQQPFLPMNIICDRDTQRHYRSSIVPAETKSFSLCLTTPQYSASRSPRCLSRYPRYLLTAELLPR